MQKLTICRIVFKWFFHLSLSDSFPDNFNTAGKRPSARDESFVHTFLFPESRIYRKRWKSVYCITFLRVCDYIWYHDRMESSQAVWTATWEGIWCSRALLDDLRGAAFARRVLLNQETVRKYPWITKEIPGMKKMHE